MAFSWKQGLALVSASGVAAGMLVVGTAPAQAAQFDAKGVAPTVTGLTTSAPFTPDTTETVTATVGDADKLKDLDTIVLQLSGSGGTPGIATKYNSYTITYTRSGNSFGSPLFASDNNSAWSNVASSAPANLNLTSGTVTFSFNVPKIARQNTNWVATVIATDKKNNSANDTDTGLTMEGFQSISSLTAEDFGQVDTGASGAITNSPTVVTNHNGNALYTAQTTWTLAGESDTVNVVSAAGAPAAAQIKINCAATDPVAVNDGTALVGASATTVQTTSASTVETGQTEATNCRLWNGGGTPSGVYSGTLTISVT